MQQQPSEMHQLQNTWLVEALRRNNAAEFRWILDKEGWPREWSDYELLVMAANCSHRRIVDVLLDKGCRVAKDGCSAKAFHCVIKHDWLDVVEKFLRRGARVYDQDFEGNTALHVAFFYGASEPIMELLIKRLAEETSLNLENNDGVSVWHIMCAGMKREYIEEALDRGFADVNSKVSSKGQSFPVFAGYTALHFAAQYNRLETAKLLLERNANIYARDATGSTPLHVACKCRNVKMIDLIFSYDKLNDNFVNNFGLSHFMAACAGSDVSIVKYFLKTADSQPWTCPKALVNSQVNVAPYYYPVAGYAPLHFAAEFGRYETVELLLSYEPFCCPVTASKFTPSMLANKGKHQNVFQALWRYCGSYRKNKQQQAAAGDQNQTTVKSDSGGYRVPDAWFLKYSHPREYPRHFNIRGLQGRKVIPLYGPKPGTQYPVTVKYLYNPPQIRTYFML